MPGCAAIGCNNSSEKGFSMRCFPKDLKRRREWAIRMKRDKWFPTDSSRLCEVHFSPEMWEKVRVDGKKKLKANAVPDIFIFTKNVPTRKAPVVRSSSLKSIASTSLEDVVPSTSGYPCALPQVSTSSITLDCASESSINISQNISNDVSTEKSSDDTISQENIIFERRSKKKQLEMYKKVLHKKVISLRSYKNKFRKASSEIKQLQRKLNASHNNMFGGLFNDDQITALARKREKKTTKLMKWCDNTIIKALRLKFSCGNSGYEEILKQNLPYPSIRTLQRRLQHLQFDSGILYEVFNFLKHKIESFKENEKDCVLVLDEMAITPGTTFDVSLNKYFGDVTLPEHTGPATHVLVFMLAGVNSRWKQMIAYYFTGNSVDGTVFKNIILEIFQQANIIKLNIISITSDMGSANQALWRTLGIGAGRYEIIRNSIPNPIELDKRVFILADVPHLFKNLKSSFISNKIIKISKSIQKKYNLPTDIADSSHIFELLSFQDQLHFKLAPKLSENDLMPSHYDKMKVGKSTNVLSHDVSSALKFVAEELNKPQYLTTAWFIDICEKWFYLMSSRSPSNAISKFNYEKYMETKNFLIEFMEIISDLEIGIKKIWKPSQTGILISTKSILQIQEFLIEDRGYEFVLTGRFSQDCLENLFSVLRSKQIIPNAVQVKNNLKLICVSQYLKCPKGSSYDEDDREYLENFLKIVEDGPKIIYDPVTIPDEIPFNDQLNFSEINSLYNIAGYIINSIKLQSKTCNKCISDTGSNEPLFKNFTKFTRIKCYRLKTLFFCHEHIFYFFVDMELLFRKYYKLVSSQNINLKSFFINKILEIDSPIISDCHGMKNKIISRYVVFRLKIASKKNKSLMQKHASKSMR